MVGSGPAVEETMSGKTEAEKALATAADRKEVKLALFHISFFLSAAAIFVLLSFLVPGASKRFQFQCWHTAAVGLFSAAVIAKRHPIVWSLLVRPKAKPLPVGFVH